jgi:hypothetical protein
VYPPSGILYKEDFSVADGSWPMVSDNGSSISYQFEGLRFNINRPNYDYWSTPAMDYKNVRISVLSAKLGGPDDNRFGVICRMNEHKNFYAFLISSDGYAGILKVRDGNYSILSSEQMQFFDVIRQGEYRNDIEAGCVGALLTLSVNGEKILEAVDHEYVSGKVGLLAGSGDIAGVDIFFDDFVVRNP